MKKMYNKICSKDLSYIDKEQIFGFHQEKNYLFLEIKNPEYEEYLSLYIYYTKEGSIIVARLDELNLIIQDNKIEMLHFISYAPQLSSILKSSLDSKTRGIRILNIKDFTNKQIEKSYYCITRNIDFKVTEAELNETSPKFEKLNNVLMELVEFSTEYTTSYDAYLNDFRNQPWVRLSSINKIKERFNYNESEILSGFILRINDNNTSNLTNNIEKFEASLCIEDTAIYKLYHQISEEDLKDKTKRLFFFISKKLFRTSASQENRDYYVVNLRRSGNKYDLCIELPWLKEALTNIDLLFQLYKKIPFEYFKVFPFLWGQWISFKNIENNLSAYFENSDLVDDFYKKRCSHFCIKENELFYKESIALDLQNKYWGDLQPISELICHGITLTYDILDSDRIKALRKQMKKKITLEAIEIGLNILKIVAKMNRVS